MLCAQKLLGERVQAHLAGACFIWGVAAASQTNLQKRLRMVTSTCCTMQTSRAEMTVHRRCATQCPPLPTTPLDPPTHDCFLSFLSFGSPSGHRYTHRAPQPAASPRLPLRCPCLSYYKSCSPTTALATTTLPPPLPKSLPQPSTRPRPTRPRPRTPKIPGAPHCVKHQY